MRISSISNISVNNNRPVFKGFRTTPNAFAAGATFRNKEERDAMVRSYAEANSIDIASVGLLAALFNRAVDAAQALTIARSPEHQARVAALDELVRVKTASLFAEA